MMKTTKYKQLKMSKQNQQTGLVTNIIPNETNDIILTRTR